MSDITIKPRRPGSVTTIAIIVLILSISGLYSAVVNLIPILITGKPSGLLLIIREFYPSYIREMYTPIIEAFDNTTVFFYLLFAAGAIISLLGLFTAISLFKSKPNVQFLGKIYIIGYSVLLAGTVFWLGFFSNSLSYFSQINESSRFADMFNTIFQVTLFAGMFIGIGIGVVFIVLFSRILYGHKNREYFREISKTSQF